MPNIVDRFNVGGDDYYIEPVMDDVPTEGSQQTVKSGGVFQAIKNSDVMKNDKFIATMLGTRMFAAVKIASVQPVGGVGFLARRGDLLFNVDGNVSWNTSVSVDGDIWYDTGVVFVRRSTVLYSFEEDGTCTYDQAAVWEHGGLYVAVTTNGIAYSSNGTDWTLAYSVSVTASQPCLVMYVAGVWFALISAKAYYSFNGEDWDICAGIPTDLRDYNRASIYYGNGVYVYINDYSSDDTKNFYYSTDGSTWVAATGTHHQCDLTGLNVLFRNGLWLVSCYGGCCWSEDGKNWTQATLSDAIGGSNRFFGAIAYMESSGRYVATSYQVNDSSATVGMWYSSDGKTWAKATGTVPTGGSSTRGIFIYGIIAFTFSSSSSEGIFISNNGTSWYKNTSIQKYAQGNILHFKHKDIGYLIDASGRIGYSPYHDFDIGGFSSFVIAKNGNLVVAQNGGISYNSVANMRSLGLINF